MELLIIELYNRKELLDFSILFIGLILVKSIKKERGCYMIKEFDGSQKMMEDIIYIDSKSFKDIDVNVDELCKRIKKNKQYQLFIKYSENIPVAYLGILYMSNLHYDGAWIDLVAVVEEHRNKGIGKELLKFAENMVKEKKGTVLTGLVRKDNVSSSTMFLNSNFESSEKDFILYSKNI
ncbi:N-acetyltransferase [Fusobacterium nucleatum subsp. nucleatum ATCC 25586]|uniref:N-acetyltransferase n=3 Tax=Fusobacterium nucleatum subsp. nucleatum TaxID=76856 RepID=A0ABN5J4N3_FUSNN|nr:N-acetyltransferase [Fusobacterium nucleatum subsp. nucleatum]AVQ15599.1 N-acetyltransferase [Fusobacterium nucleatum subsp. nucleatum ATCC 25586]